ncbi:MAG: ATP-binding protein, partial [Raineya sp.]
VFFYDNATQKTQLFNVKNANLVSDLVNDIFEDSKGQIWIGTNYGISVYNEGVFKNYSRKNGLPSEYILSICEDKNKNIWIATLGGLLKYDIQTSKFILLTEENGILYDNVYSVLVDSENQIWAGTQIGITKLKLDKQSNPISTENYSKNSGFAGLETNEKAIFEDKKGNIWFGTVRGLIRYEPRKTLKNKKNIQLQITEIDLFFQKTDWTKEQYSKFHEGLIQWSFVPKNLKLPYDKNYLSFHFEVNDYSNNENITYQWILEGLETEWNKSSTKTEVSYTNLPPNKYTFKVKAFTIDGLERSEVVSYSFEISPAFWQTWWFALLIFLLLALAVVIVIRQRFLLIENQKKMLQIKVAEASRTLLEQNDALLEQKQEIEKQKIDLQQLNATKDKFFSILAHDIKGPLNSLTAFLNIMTNHLDEMSQDDIRFMSSNLNKSVKNLYSLLENVLSWSRSQMGVLEYKYEAIDLYEIIEQNIELLSVSAQNKGINLVNKAQKNLLAWADRNSINTVLRNLISNAIKFTSTDGTISISSQAMEDKVVVDVRDTGVGMSEEVMKKIFQIDARYTTKGTANETGTGLGLVLVKEFIEKNNGTLKVESQEAKGSTFIFTLPLPPKNSDAENNIKNASQSAETKN